MLEHVRAPSSLSPHPQEPPLLLGQPESKGKLTAKLLYIWNQRYAELHYLMNIFTWYHIKLKMLFKNGWDFRVMFLIVFIIYPQTYVYMQGLCNYLKFNLDFDSNDAALIKIKQVLRHIPSPLQMSAFVPPQSLISFFFPILNFS